MTAIFAPTECAAMVEAWMRKTIPDTLAMMAALAAPASAQTVPQIAFDSVPNLLKLPPKPKRQLPARNRS